MTKDLTTQTLQNIGLAAAFVLLATLAGVMAGGQWLPVALLAGA